MAQQRERELLDRLGDSFSSEIERRIEKAVSMTQIIRAQINLSGPQKLEAHFDEIAADLMGGRELKYLVLGLAPDGVVTDVYPDYNDNAVGLNLKLDPHRQSHVTQTIESNSITLTGPYDLMVGGRGYVGRNPLTYFEDDQKHFWGFVTVAIREQYLFSDTDLDKFRKSNLAVRLITVDPFSGQETIAFDSGVSKVSNAQLIAVPNGVWRLETSRINAEPISTVSLVWNFITAALLGLLASIIARYPERLRDEVRFKTRKIEQHEQFFTDLIRSLPDAIAVTDVNADILYHNPRFTEIIDEPPTKGSSLIRALESSLKNSNIRQFLLSRVSLKAFDFHIMVALSPHGDFQLNCSAFATADGPVLLWVFRDVTELSLVNKTLRSVSATREEMLQLIPDPMAFFDKHGKLIESNPGFKRSFADLLKIEPGMTVADFEDQLFSVCKGGSSFYPVQDILRTTTSNRMLVDELVLDGPVEAVFERSVAIDQTSSTVGCIMHFRDITAAREVDKMKTDFLSTAAHELRTPLANILGYTELLISAPFEKAKQKELLSVVHHQSKRLSAIIDDLLDLAKIEARAGETFNFAEHSLTALLQLVVRKYEHELAAFRFNCAIPSEPAKVWCDAAKIEQVVDNIVSNAIKYTESDATISLSLTAAESEGMTGYMLIIEDDGIGMSPEDLERIYERFYRADRSGHKPGTGLGMSIVKQIVDHHRGSIQVQSEIGTGTRISVWLAAAKDHVEEQFVSAAG